MFTESENLAICNLYKSIESNMLPFDKQEAQEGKEGFWCSDWWNIEICKFLARRADYLKEPLPDKFLWKREELLTAMNYKLRMFSLLKDVSNFSNRLFVCEVGRGADILLASFIKKWDKITCYDINPYVLEKVNAYFKNELHLSIETFKVNSGDFDFSKLDKKVILLANQCRLGKKCTEDIRENPNILAIVDGEILEKE